MQVLTNVAFCQGAGCRFALHIGSVFIAFGRRPGIGARLELFTPFHKFRWSRGQRQ